MGAKKCREMWRKVEKNKQIFKKSLEPSCEETGLNQSLQQSLLVWRTSEMPEKPRTIHYGLFPFQHALVGSGTKGFYSFSQRLCSHSYVPEAVWELQM